VAHACVGRIMIREQPSATHPHCATFLLATVLTPVLDKPAFSRFSQIFKPQFVVPNLMEFVKRQVCVQNGGELPTAVRELIEFMKTPKLLPVVLIDIIASQNCAISGPPT